MSEILTNQVRVLLLCVCLSWYRSLCLDVHVSCCGSEFVCFVCACIDVVLFILMFMCLVVCVVKVSLVVCVSCSVCCKCMACCLFVLLFML
jgi:hypothetical protein